MTRADELVRSIRDDLSSGALELASRAADGLLRLIPGAGEGAPALTPERLARLALDLAAAQPSMAPLTSLAHCVLFELESGDLVGGGLGDVRAAVTGLRRRLAKAPERMAAHASGLLRGARVLTLSASGSVAAALSREPALVREVVCLEGRPNLEGRSLAARLAQAGVPCTVAVDAAVGALAPRVDLVLVGADSIGDGGVANKIGTRPAALVAAAAGVPAVVLADGSKLLPPGYPRGMEDERPAGEVWAGSPPGVHVWNRYFELTPLAAFRDVVTDEGLRTPAQLEAERRELRGHERVRRALSAGA